MPHADILGPRNLNGARPSLPDARDAKYRFHAPMLSAFRRLPVAVDPRKFPNKRLPRMEDQKHLGSCVGHAWTTACEYRLKRLGVFTDELSRLMTYYTGRVDIEGQNPMADEGMFGRSGGLALRKVGVSLESLWPYDVDKYHVDPGARAREDASTRQVITFHQCATLNDSLWALAGGYPVVLAFLVPQSTGSDEVTRTGRIPLPKPDEPIVGAHMVCALGYDRRTKEYIGPNSWSAQWGEEGWFRYSFYGWKQGTLFDVFALKALEDGR